MFLFGSAPFETAVRAVKLEEHARKTAVRSMDAPDIDSSFLRFVSANWLLSRLTHIATSKTNIYYKFIDHILNIYLLMHNTIYIKYYQFIYIFPFAKNHLTQSM